MKITIKESKEITMKTTLIRLSLFMLALLIAVSSESFAGRGDKSGTAAAPMLLIPVGGRDLAMGSSTIANTFGIEAIHFNPAGLAWTKKSSEAIFSHMNYIADIGVDYIGVSSSFEGFGTIAFSIKSLSIGTINITTETNPDGTGETFTPRFSIVGFTYSNALTDRISIGVTTNLITEQMDRASSTGVAFNFGVQYKNFANLSGFNLGVAVKNIGPQMQYEGPGLLRTGQIDDLLRSASFYSLQAAKADLPSVIELGLSYQMKINDQAQVNLASIFENQNFSDDEYKLGAEFAWDETFFIRGGYNLAQESFKKSYIFGPTLGAGITQNFDGLDFTFDYAYRTVTYFEANHVFSLKLGF